MKKSSIRVLIAYIFIVIAYILIISLQIQNFSDELDFGGEIGKLVLIFGIASIGSGFIGGIIAPYSYTQLIKYIAISLGVIILIAVGIILILTDAAGDVSGLAGLIVLILLVVVVIGIVIVIAVTSAGLFFGAYLGSYIGKTFQEDYNKSEKDLDESIPTLDSS